MMTIFLLLTGYFWIFSFRTWKISKRKIHLRTDCLSGLWTLSKEVGYKVCGLSHFVFLNIEDEIFQKNQPSLICSKKESAIQWYAPSFPKYAVIYLDRTAMILLVTQFIITNAYFSQSKINISCKYIMSLSVWDRERSCDGSRRTVSIFHYL